MDFVWSSEGHYAVRSDTGMISVFHQFKVKNVVVLPWQDVFLFHLYFVFVPKRRNIKVSNCRIMLRSFLEAV